MPEPVSFQLMSAWEMILCIQRLCTVYNVLHTGMEHVPSPSMGNSRKGLYRWAMPQPLFIIFSNKSLISCPCQPSTSSRGLRWQVCTAIPNLHPSLWLVDCQIPHSKLCLMSLCLQWLPPEWPEKQRKESALTVFFLRITRTLRASGMRSCMGSTDFNFGFFFCTVIFYSSVFKAGLSTQ